MLELVASGYIPAPYVQTTGGDPATVWLGIIALLALAVAVTAALVYSARPRSRVEKTFATTRLQKAA